MTAVEKSVEQLACFNFNLIESVCLRMVLIGQSSDLQHVLVPGELLSPSSLDAIDEVVGVGEEGAAASSSSAAAAADSDDSLLQSVSVPLVESIDEALVPDIIAGTAGASSVFQSAWVAPSSTPYDMNACSASSSSATDARLTFSPQFFFFFCLV